MDTCRIAKEFRWVRVVTSMTNDGEIHQLIGTTSSPDRDDGLDNLLYRHRSQIGLTPVVWSSICYMNALGEMSREFIGLPDENI